MDGRIAHRESRFVAAGRTLEAAMKVIADLMCNDSYARFAKHEIGLAYLSAPEKTTASR
jgi:hypothetical protein